MAQLERGRIAEVRDGGYIVESLDRRGIVSPPIAAIGDAEYAEDDTVLFALFADGTGMILAQMA